jgi:hypothetical protein
MPILFDVDPEYGAYETFDYDNDNGRVTIRRICDVQPIIDRNKELQNHTDCWNEAKDMRLAASIPNEVALMWLNDYGVNCWRKEHWPAVKKLLNSNEWKYLRTNTFYL